jgi:hypothetical protein
MRKINKKASVEMSFNTIFSIILIIVFILAAVYGIKKFMNISHCSQIGIFKNELQTEIDKAWAGSGEYIYAKTLTIPSSITHICFGNKNISSTGEYKEYFRDFEYVGAPQNNFFFVPMAKACDFKTSLIKHVNLEKTTSSLNPYCIPVVNGKVSIKLTKRITDALVCIGDDC